MRTFLGALVIGFVGMASAVHAEGHYCLKGTSGMQPGSGADAKLIYKECAIGDTIAINPGLSAMIPEVCDFSKAIVSAQTGVTFCVLGPLKPMKK